MKYWFLLISCVLLSAGMSACKGGVEHPPQGQPNSKNYCADRKASENNCMACASQPGCGWCDMPQEGQANCQPGVAHESPGTCSDGWALSTEQCAAPPPPPPPPPPAAESLDEATE